MNKEELRRNKLFTLLAELDDYKPTSYFSNKLSVSEKTLYADVNSLNKELAGYNLEITKTPRKGLLLVGNKSEMENYSSLHKNSEEENYSPIYRQRVIAKKLVVEAKKVNCDELEQELFVSKTPLRNDIQKLKNYFEFKKTAIVLNNGELFISGEERNIQNAYKSYEIDYYKKNSRLTLAEISKEAEHTFDKAISKMAVKIVEQYSSQSQRGMSEVYASSLFFSICVLISRAKNGFHIKEKSSNFAFQMIEKMETYMLAVNSASTITSELGVVLKENDIEFLSELLFSYGIQPTVNNYLVNEGFENSVNEIIEKMSQILKVDLSDDTRLHDSLLAHLVPMIYRLNNGFAIKNPLLESIRKQYLVMFTLTWYVSSIIEEKYKVTLNDDEVSFLTIHFQVAFAKKSKPKNILIVCPTGLATAELVYSQIKDILPANDHVEIATVNQVLDNDVKDVDFIISVVTPEHFKDINKKVFYVSPLITQEELNEISKYYGSINEQLRSLRNVGKVNLLELTNYLDDNFLYWQYDMTSKEEILNFMISQYEKNGYVTSDFRGSILARENEGITSMYTGVAMPHASFSTVKKTLISIMTLKKSVLWGDNEVNTIVMVAVAEENVENVRGIISKLYDLIESKDKTNLLVNVKNTTEFAILLQDVSKKEVN